MTPRVLYVVGSGRNGSTIIANILGDSPSAVSVGEVFYIWDRGFFQNRLCGCGKPFLDCQFWSKVCNEAEIDEEVAHEAMVLVGRVARTRQAILPTEKSHSDRLGQILSNLYEAIASVSKAEVIVDSSKTPMYGRVLDQIPSLDLTPLLVVRDPRAVAFSWMRKKRQLDKPGVAYMTRHGPIQSTLTWVTWNVLVLKFWNEIPIIRYEDFAADPTEVIEKICESVRIPLPSRQTNGHFDLVSSHTVSGNPVRFTSGQIDIVPDTEWEAAMSWTAKATVAALALPIMGKFGYKLFPDSASQ